MHLQQAGLGTLEKIFERELHLPHAPAGRSNAPEGGARETCVRQTPHRVFQGIVGFGSEFQPMTFLGHPKVLVQGKVEAESGWTNNRIPARIAELVNRLQDKRPSIEPSLGSRMIHSDALAGSVRAVIADIRVSSVDTGKRVDREPGSPGRNASYLPSARHALQDPPGALHLPS